MRWQIMSNIILLRRLKKTRVQPTTTNHEIAVWDPLVRIVHWALVIAFTIAYLTEDELLELHVWAGYAVLGLVLLRILWGFIGTRHARFSDFVFPLAGVWNYIKQLGSPKPPRYVGHNPAGGLMIVIMLVMLLLISFTGLAVYAAEEHKGPLVGLFSGVGGAVEEVLEEGHEVLADATMVLVFIHLAGVLLEGLIHRENLVRAMFTGRKRA